MISIKRASKLVPSICGVVAITTTVLAAPVLQTQDAFTVVHAFDRGIDGDRPKTSLIQATDGNFYGTTAAGGVYGDGSIYRITPDGTETVLHSFNVRTDGAYPSALIQGTDGHFYGTAVQTIAGRTPFGFIFRMAGDGTFTTLYTFACGADGARPVDALVQADDGNFYGTTSGYASNSCVAPATIFRMTPDGSVSTIHVFTGGTDGTEPAAPLIQARDGDLYGTTQYGGPFGGGTVFRTTLDGTLTVLHAFHAPVDYEGGQPGAALVEGRLDGDLYGTTTTGGRCLFCGTIFRLSPDGTFAVVYSFEDGAGTGIHPFAALIQGREGNFYGTTSRGGTVFQITPEGELTVLHVFAGDWDGSAPQAALLQATDGAFYGTATGGGPSSTGTVFRVTADGTFDVIYTFPGSQEGASPSALIEAADGNLYGIALAGGTFNRGTVFQMLPDGTPTALHAFSGDDGASPSALIQADDGTFYGMTTTGGANGVGTLFQITGDGRFTVLQAFMGDRFSSAAASIGLVQASDGNIYGATARDGAYGRGAVFRLTAGGTFTILYSFTGGADGSQPMTLLQATDGNFYGTTYFGGVRGTGTAFRMTSDGTVTTLPNDFDFRRPARSTLIQATDGNFYLTNGNDVVRMTREGDVTLVHTFAGAGEGWYPQGLMQAADGNLYGTTYLEPAAFRMTLDGAVSVLHLFSYEEGWEPHATPMQASDGNLYGTTWYGGGPGKQGVVFRLALPN